MAQDGAADVHGDAAEEDVEHEDPLEVLEERREEGFLAGAIAKHGKGNHAGATEDDDDGKEDAEGIDVVVIESGQIPAH